MYALSLMQTYRLRGRSYRRINTVKMVGTLAACQAKLANYLRSGFKATALKIEQLKGTKAEGNNTGVNAHLGADVRNKYAR